ncbi:MAG: cytochrome c oxidase subunit II [Tistlia sp.]|uniref:cytochrome c oxidase subunit II n=1 Tax=Tistlia sp. TaxID=3057121 RepID=UPI0034A546D5
MRWFVFAAVLCGFAAVGETAFAAQPENWGMGLQTSATEVKDMIEAFHDELLVITVAITLFVIVLLAYVAFRFRASANPTPSKRTHHTLIEIAWTVVPVLILMFIAIDSFKLLYTQDRIPDAEVTVRVTGNQWNWTYGYDHPEHGSFEYTSLPLTDEEAQEQGLPRLLATDMPLMLPVDTTVRFIVTASDVLHSFTVPSFGFKIDAVPGRANETWTRVREVGTYYGQCSELCGTAHYNMATMVNVVSKEEFAAWLDQAYEEYAEAPTAPRPTRLADAAPAR